MPIYEFKCSECNHEFEELIKKRNILAVECPKCEGMAMKQMSVPSHPVVNEYNANNGYAQKGK